MESTAEESSTPSARARLVFAVVLATMAGMSAGLAAASTAASGVPGDFEFWWRGTQLWVSGANPYSGIPHSSGWPLPDPLFYPLPALILTWPLHALNLPVAAGMFMGASTGLLAWALTARGWETVVACRRAVRDGREAGPMESTTRRRRAVAVGGPCARCETHARSGARDVSVRSSRNTLVPQLLFFADQLAVGLVARTRSELTALVALQLAAWSAWFALVKPTDAYVNFAAPFVLLGVYLPAVVMILRRPNIGSVPAWLEERLARARVPGWLKGQASPD